MGNNTDRTWIINRREIVEVEQFIDYLIELHQYEEKYKAVSLVYNFFGGLIIKHEFDRCNEIIDSIVSEKLNAWLLMSFLTLSSPYKDKITRRDEVYNQAMKQLKETLTPSQFTATQNRLK